MLYIKNPQVFKAIKAINLSIIMFIIHKKGKVTIDEVEKFTDIEKVSNDLVFNLLQIMANNGNIKIEGGTTITASVATLKKIMRDEKINLPSNYGHPWSEADYVKLAELSMEGVPIYEIAKTLNRTEQSVKQQCQLLRKAYKLIEIIKNYPIVLEFCKTSSFPDPIIDNHKIEE